MTHYCKICGEELAPEEEFEGICKNCKLAKSHELEDTGQDDYDPGVT